MAFDDSQKNGDHCMTACDHVVHHVVALVHARGIEMSLDMDPGRAPFEVITETHRIHLTHKGVTSVVTVDHETFMDEEFFRTLVLHQIEAAIDDLMSEMLCRPTTRAGSPSIDVDQGVHVFTCGLTRQ